MAKFIPNWNCHYWVSQQTELTQSETPPTAITDSIILSKGTWSIKGILLHHLSHLNQVRHELCSFRLSIDIIPIRIFQEKAKVKIK